MTAEPRHVPDTAWQSSFTGKRKIGTMPRGLFVIAFHPDGWRALSSSIDEAVIWDLRSGEAIRRFDGGAFGFIDLAFDPRGTGVLTAGSPVRYWDVESGRDIVTVKDVVDDDGRLPPLPASAVAISPTGALGASARSGTVTIWDLRTGAAVRAAPLPGRVLALRFEEEEVTLQIVTSESLCDVGVAGDSPPRCVEMPLHTMDRFTSGATDGQSTILGGALGEVFAVSRSDGKPIRKASPNVKAGVFSLSLSPRSSRFLVMGEQKAAVLGMKRFERVATLGPFATPTTAGTISERGNLALVAETSGDIWLVKLPED